MLIYIVKLIVFLGLKEQDIYLLYWKFDVVYNWTLYAYNLK